MSDTLLLLIFLHIALLTIASAGDRILLLADAWEFLARPLRGMVQVASYLYRQ